MGLVTQVVENIKKRKAIRDAKEYVTGPGAGHRWALSGSLQLQLLQRNGCVPSSNVLEVGCGSLSAGIPIIRLLEAGHYAGIDPNKWLIDTILQVEEYAALVQLKKPIFLYNENFDATESNLQFDYVISHSILSHAPRSMTEMFLKNLKPSLKPTAKVIASLRMTDKHGNLKGDSDHTTWQYPGNTFYAWETVQAVADALGYTATWEKDYREFMVKHSPSEYHDWIVFTLK